MRVRNLMLAAVAVLAVAMPARAALILEYIQVSAINAAPSAGPALTNLVIDPTVNAGVSFIQVALRDTLGGGPDAGQPGTVAWQTNGGNAGPGSLGVASFFVRFDGIPGVAVNPAPLSNANQRLIPAGAYGLIAAGSSPPTFTNYGGLLNFGSEPGLVPDPVTGRIALFNLRITALAAGVGSFNLSDPNPAPTAVDNSLLQDSDPFGTPNAGTIVPIDSLIFPGNSSYSLPVVVTPEPTSLAFAGLALAGLGVRKLRKKSA